MNKRYAEYRKHGSFWGFPGESFSLTFARGRSYFIPGGTIMMDTAGGKLTLADRDWIQDCQRSYLCMREKRK